MFNDNFSTYSKQVVSFDGENSPKLANQLLFIGFFFFIFYYYLCLHKENTSQIKIKTKYHSTGCCGYIFIYFFHTRWAV